MKERKGIIIMIAVFFLQPFFGSLVPALGKPDVVMCMMIAGVLYFNEEKYMPLVITGCILELIRDLAVAQYIGTGVISAIAAVFAALLMKWLIKVDEPAGAAMMAFVCAFAKQMAFWLVFVLTGSHMGFIYVMAMSWPNIIGDTVLIMILFFFAEKNRRHDIGNGFFV